MTRKYFLIDQNRDTKKWKVSRDSSPWGKIREDVMTRDGYRCVKCGLGRGDGVKLQLHVHHRTPKSQGGSNELENLETLCKHCHILEHPHMKDISPFEEMLNLDIYNVEKIRESTLNKLVPEWTGKPHMQRPIVKKMLEGKDIYGNRRPEGHFYTSYDTMEKMKELLQQKKEREQHEWVKKVEKAREEEEKRKELIKEKVKVEEKRTIIEYWKLLAMDELYNKSRAYSILNNHEKALESLKKAIELDTKFKEMAKTDKDFDKIRETKEFKQLTEQQ